MALPPGITEVRPEGYFVGSSSLPDEGHIRNPMCVEGSRCCICRFPIDREKDKIVTRKYEPLVALGTMKLTERQ
jgi:hypothetical protein